MKKFSRATLGLVVVVILSIVILTSKLANRNALDTQVFLSKLESNLNSGSPEQLASNISDSELALYGVSREAAARFIREYFRKKFPLGTSFARAEVVSEGSPYQTIAVFKAGNSGASMDLMLEPLDGKICSPNLLSAMIFQAGIGDSYASVPGKSRSEKKLNTFKMLAEVEGPKLQALGIPGVVRTSSEGLITWNQFADITRKRIASLR